MFDKFHRFVPRSRNLRRSLPFVAGVALLGGLAIGCASETESEPQDAMTKMVDQRIEAVLDDIDATEVQREQIHALKAELLAEVKKHKGEREEVHAQVEELWLSDDVDPEKVHAMVDQRIDKMRATAHKATDAAIELHSILTAEQRKLLAEQAEQRRNRWHRHFHGE